MKKTSAVCHDLWGNKKKINVNKLTFRPSVYGVLIKKGKVLLSRQWDGYDFPGGGMDIGETLDETLEREFHEETGLWVKKTKIIHAVTSFFTLAFKKNSVNSILLYYVCKKIGGRLSAKHLDEYEKKYAQLAEWVDLKRVNKIKFYNPVNSPAIIRQASKLK